MQSTDVICWLMENSGSVDWSRCARARPLNGSGYRLPPPPPCTPATVRAETSSSSSSSRSARGSRRVRRRSSGRRVNFCVSCVRAQCSRASVGKETTGGDATALTDSTAQQQIPVPTATRSSTNSG
ncbi:unnamed protein product [Heligmosomoides polygyrus]|uniref:Uncharacterized protein n=1 Tax=Heligmosomoides polygyrus TaxID=6339 RepID=A0A183G1T4_HELPZ|nr:unnamed protein product [Heligmosomoides polygyrus]